MKYEILKFDIKQSAKGTTYAIAMLKGNEVYENVTVFGSHPGFIDLKVGAFIECELEANDYNGKKGWKAKALVSAPKWAGAKTNKTAEINKAMDKKVESIKEAQENRAEGVKVASTFRDATLITVELARTADIVPEDKEDYLKAKWQEIRNWLWQNWDVDSSQMPPF